MKVTYHDDEGSYVMQIADVHLQVYTVHHSEGHCINVSDVSGVTQIQLFPQP